MTTRARIAVATLALLAGLASWAPAQEGAYELKDGRYVPVAPPRAGTPEGHLALIRKHLREDDPSKALKEVQAFLKQYPDHPGREEALSLAGEAQMQRGRYFKAYESFERQIDQYPAGSLLERALQREYEIADAFLRGKKRIELGFLPVPAQDDGLEILLRIAEQAPGSRWSEKALLRAADYHFDKAQYNEAIDAYDQFLALHAEISEQAPYAYLQAARATYALYDGPAYDEAPLIDARQRYRQFAELYPQRAQEVGVPQVLSQIDQALAHKLYRTGEFYVRIGQPRSAVVYYHQTTQDYPQTQWAAKAAQRLEAMDPQLVAKALELISASAQLDGSNAR